MRSPAILRGRRQSRREALLSISSPSHFAGERRLRVDARRRAA
jgi:hypothetical protein